METNSCNKNAKNPSSRMKVLSFKILTTSNYTRNYKHYVSEFKFKNLYK